MQPNNLPPGFVTIEDACKLIQSDTREKPVVDMDYLVAHTVWIETNHNFRIPKIRMLKPEEVKKTKRGKYIEYENIGDVYVRIDTNYQKELLKKNDCLVVGVCGRWNGPAEGGKFISNFYDLMSIIGHLDYYKVTDRNGHLIIEGYHHDGHDRYEIKQLTNKGYALARSYGFDSDRQLHSTIMNCNIFSRLPRLATL